MSNLENQLSNIKNKDVLHRMIDALDDEAIMCIIVRHGYKTEQKGGASYFHYGRPLFMEINYLIDQYKLWILQ